MSADEIARRAERGEDISKFFTNDGKMMPPIQRVNVDFSREMLTELDEAVRQLNISRQAVTKRWCAKASTGATWPRPPARARAFEAPSPKARSLPYGTIPSLSYAEFGIGALSGRL